MDLIPEQKTTPLERAQWDYDRACLLLERAARKDQPTEYHTALKRKSDAYGALLVAKHKAAPVQSTHEEGES